MMAPRVPAITCLPEAVPLSSTLDTGNSRWPRGDRMRLAALWLCLWMVLKGAAAQPHLSARDIVNAAGRSAGGVAPGEIVVLFPSHAGPEVLAGSQLTAEGKVAALL